MPDFPNLPQVRVDRLDGGLRSALTDEAPLILLLGTSSQGPGDDPIHARDSSRARLLFGGDSEIYQGLVEARRAYGDGANIWLFRIGTTPAILTISGSNGKAVKVIPKDRVATIGDTWKASFNALSGYLWVYNDQSNLVYSNSPANPVDIGELEIRGSIAALSGAQSFGDDTGGTVELSVAFGVSGSDNPLASGTTFIEATTGPDQNNLKRRYEALEDAYRLLESFDCDIAVPLHVNADDANVAYFVSGVSSNRDKQPWNSIDNPIVMGSGTLGWFKEVAPTVSSVDGSFTYTWADDIFVSGVGDISGSPNLFMTPSDRISRDFHEVSFAYQLANFCYQHTKNQSTCIGVLGMRPPESYYLGDIHRWIGRPPVKNAAGTITTDGFGLCGFPETAGATGARLNPLCTDKIAGRSPGFFATDSEAKDESPKVDSGGNPIDIGAYLSLAAEFPLHVNAVNGVTGYSNSVASFYAGMIAKLDEKEAPTNKVAAGIFVPYPKAKSRQDDLVAAKMIIFIQRPDGTVCVDAPTAATNDSDFKRLTTVRLIALAEDRVRAIGRRYIGKVSNNMTREGFKNELEEGLQNLVKRGYLKNFRYDISATPVQDVLGQLFVKLVLVVPNELRQIFTTVALSIE